MDRSDEHDLVVFKYLNEVVSTVTVTLTISLELGSFYMAELNGTFPQERSCY